jgi:hypothetical protein
MLEVTYRRFDDHDDLGINGTNIRFTFTGIVDDEFVSKGIDHGNSGFVPFQAIENMVPQVRSIKRPIKVIIKRSFSQIFCQARKIDYGYENQE